MEQLERLTARLDNIQAVQPILNALRAISSSSRVLALRKARSVDQYRQDLLRILAFVAPHLSRSYRRPSAARANGSLVLLVIGSERGLCGAFNDTVVDYATQVLAQYAAAGTDAKLMTLGTRVQRAFRGADYRPQWSRRLSATALPSYRMACELTSEWLQTYEKHDIDAVEVIYNTYQGLARYEPTKVRVVPPELPFPPTANTEWPPSIETDPLGLHTRAVELWLSATLYAIMLKSAAAENSARFRLLDGASQNAERLIEELKLFLQVARQDAITSELQDLSSGAGLLGPRSE